MPKLLEPIADRAKTRLRRHHASPGVAVEVEKVSEYGYRLASPHSDHESWEAMICDALGTRSISTARTFLFMLTELCAQHHQHSEVDGEHGEWVPDETELTMILHMVAGVKPTNEIEAAQAAQMVAVHLMQMRLSARALRNGMIVAEDAALAGKLARTFTMQVDGMAKLKGKRRSSKQTIIVKQEKHVHDHRHVHLGRGGEDFGGQPQAKDGDAPLATLLSGDAPAPAVPISGSNR
jgi:hypothetical protein